MKKSLTLAALLIVAASTPSAAQFGRLKGMVGKGDKPDSAKVVADSIAKAAADSGKGEQKQGGGRFGGLMNKVMSKTVLAVANVAGNMMTKSTADLATVTPLVTRGSNLYPSSVGTLETQFLKNWGSGGGDLVTIMFTNTAGSWASKIDGTVTIDGKPADYSTMGVYSAMIPASTGPRAVEVTTTSGQKASFSIPAPKGSIRIASVNGQANPGSLDLTKDVTVEFADFDAADTTSLHVKIVASTLALKGFYDVGIFRPAAKLVIPAAAFRNLNMAPGNTSVANFGDNYLLVSRDRIENLQQMSGQYANEKVVSSVMDGRFFKTSNDPKLNKGITAKGDVGSLNYDVYKAHAFASRPLSQVKSVALTSLAIRGKTQFAKTSDSRLTGMRREQSASFRISDAGLDRSLEELHQALVAIVNEEIAPVLPIARVTGSPTYKSLSPFASDDENTEIGFSRSYRDLTLLSAFMPIATGYGPNRVDSKLLAETGASALMRVTLDLVLGEDALVTPTLAFDLTGEPHGAGSSTKYFAGMITGKGAKLRNSEMTVSEVTRTPELAAAFRAALRDIKAKETANTDYKELWTIQR